MLLLAACATAPHTQLPTPSATGEASWREVSTPGMVRYPLALGEMSSGATPVQRVAPIYPTDQLTTCPPPQEVQALLIVDKAGKVSDVRGIVVDDWSATPSWQQFFAAVRTAALQWRFAPLQIEHWAADADGNSHVVDSETKPFSLGYVFRFECHDGKSAVSSSAATS